MGVSDFITYRWVHFDVIPEDIDSIRNKVGREFIIGINCGNDLKAVRWAAENKVDYISFCSMFPSNSAGECEIIDHETIVKARDFKLEQPMLENWLKQLEEYEEQYQLIEGRIKKLSKEL